MKEAPAHHGAMNRTGRIFRVIISLSVFLLSAFVPAPSHSGEWRVTPIKLDLGKDAKTGVITVANEADAKLDVQMRAMEWGQDGEGRDTYTETNDIIFFPRIMTLDKKEEKILRAGIKIPATAKEKTYRLFIEEIPEPQKSEGTRVAIAIKFGVPIFVKPLKEEPRGELGKIGLSKGIVEARVSNTGNVHFVINSIAVKGKNAGGKEIFSRELTGWYLLSGASRLYSAEIPRDICPDIAKISMEVGTDKFTLNGNLDVDKTTCSP